MQNHPLGLVVQRAPCGDPRHAAVSAELAEPWKFGGVVGLHVQMADHVPAILKQLPELRCPSKPVAKVLRVELMTDSAPREIRDGRDLQRTREPVR